jgi:hypothetical protein
MKKHTGGKKMSTIGKGVVTRFDRELQRCDTDIGALQSEMRALEAYRDTLRRGRDDLIITAIPRKRRPEGVRVSSRAKCIENILVTEARPMSVKEICKACEAEGLAPNKRSTYATLSMLHRKGVAVPTERGVWAAAKKVVALAG